MQFSQFGRQLLIDGRESLLSIDDEKKKIAFAQRVLGSASHPLRPPPFSGAENSAGIPQDERAFAAIALCREAVSRDPRLIMNNCNFPAKETIEQCRLAYVWPADNRYVRQHVVLTHQCGPHLRFGRMCVPFGLQLPDPVCNINDP